MRWFVGALVILLALVGIGASVAHYLVEPYNPGFRQYPAVTALHVVLGGIFLVLAPFQFVRPIRTRWPRYHRWAGRFLVGIGLVIGAAALAILLLFPTGGNPERLVVGPFALLFVYGLGRGLSAIRARRVAEHRAWMIRAFAIALSIGTMRLIFIPALILAGNPTDRQIALFSVGSFAIALLLHAAAAEFWIRRPRRGVAVGARDRAAAGPAPLATPGASGAGRAGR